MGPDLLPSRTAGACPSCGAAVRADAPFCTLCHRDLRAPAPPAPVVAPGGPQAYGVPAADPLTSPPAQPEPVPPVPSGPWSPTAGAPVTVAGRTWPCTSCGAATPIGADACPACGTGFLDDLRGAQAPALVLPLVGDLARLPRGARIGVAVALVALVVLVVFVLGLLL